MTSKSKPIDIPKSRSCPWCGKNRLKILDMYVCPNRCDIPLGMLPPRLTRQGGYVAKSRVNIKPLACSCGCGRREGEPPKH